MAGLAVERNEADGPFSTVCLDVMRRVAVTGLGVVSPIGIGAESYWAALVSGRSAIARSQRLTAQGFPVDVVAEIPEALLRGQLYRLPRKQLKLFSRVMLFGMIASSLAVEDGGLRDGSSDPTRCGVFLGTFFTTLDFSTVLHWMVEAESNAPSKELDLGKANGYCMTSINPVDYSLKTMPNLAAGHIAIGHNARGFCRVIADGCTGGLQAIGQAFLAIKENQLDVALCGGAEAPLEEFVFVNLCTLDFLARGATDPSRLCSPFDGSRSGAVLGEGAGMLLLEEHEHARSRGAQIYGEIIGYGSAAGDATIALKAERVEVVSERLGLAMKSALQESQEERVDLIVANGDSTKANDLAETCAIKALFGPTAVSIPVSASKATHGHLISGSGALELISGLLALNRRVIPPTLNLRSPDPKCDLDYVPNEARKNEGMRVALVNSIGLFGESASIVIRRVGEA
ncbi:MAG: beta-ketoacyl-[acyl-carrier-protein] synthase family protein [Deltaproteobacteria bacterium]|nr:beta-ketoacyl-[acyl-carrier-protein] synthase family protein [Deltaproteobacteria bacterium]